MDKTHLTRRAVAAGLVATPFLASPAFARAPEIFVQTSGAFRQAWTHALDGHDAVAYFNLGEDDDPVAGDPAFEADYKGAKWLFASAENRDTFLNQPEAFAPQYGGHCAWALSRNKLVKGDPAVWKVYNGKLYVNVNRGTQRNWIRNIDRDIANANENWPGILDRN